MLKNIHHASSIWLWAANAYSTHLFTHTLGTQKILNKENMGKLGEISPNLGNLLPVFKKTVKIRKIRKFRTAGMCA